MSFVIAVIYKNNDVYIVSDSQMSNKYTDKTTHDAVKISRVNDMAGIGFAGNTLFCERVIKTMQEAHAKSGYTPVCQPDIVSEFVKTSEQFIPEFSEQYPWENIEAAFLIAGYNIPRTPLISTVILHQKVVKVYNTSAGIGDFRFAVLPPADIHYDDCTQICSQFLAQPSNRDKNPESILCELVALVSGHSSFVDTIPQIWHSDLAHWIL